MIIKIRQTYRKLTFVFVFVCWLAMIPASMFASGLMPAQEKVSRADSESIDSGSSEKAAPRNSLARRVVKPKKKGEVSFDDILFEIEEGKSYEPSMITKEIKAFEGKTITIRGFILPASVFQQVGIKQFVLVRDNQECCFGPGAALYDCIMVKMVGGNSTKFSTRPIAVKGKFDVTEKYKLPDGTYMAIYEMEATLAQ